jgi:FeS assembly SUF system protein
MSDLMTLTGGHAGDPYAKLTDELVLEDEANRPNRVSVEAGTLEDRIVGVLRTVFDPEIPANVYDLGLIYDLAVGEDGAVRLSVTLTSPGCPVADMLLRDIHSKVLNVAGVARVRTTLVWDPPWTPDRMSDAARLELGWL